MKSMRKEYKILVEKPKRPLGKYKVDDRIILKGIFRKTDMRV
jgi:hypothetical protein